MYTGKSRSATVILSLFLFGLIIGPAELSGQIGGFLKKKAKDIVNPTSKTNNTAGGDQSGNQVAPRRDDSILDLNADNLDQLKKALECEKIAKDKMKNDFSREKYEKCEQETMMSSESRQLSETYKDNYSQLSAKVMALLEQKCGKSPGQWDETAALKNATSQGAKCGGFKDRQYSITAERVVAFCKLGQQEKIKRSENMYYVYTAAEVNALKPKCLELMPLLEDLGYAKEEQGKY